jgi:acyl-coenzyme A thioesterase PaaI-like protein
MREPRNPHFDQAVRNSFAAQLIARGRVVRAGRTITVCQADASMISDGVKTSVATMLATIMMIPDRQDVVG